METWLPLVALALFSTAFLLAVIWIGLRGSAPEDNVDQEEGAARTLIGDGNTAARTESAAAVRTPEVVAPALPTPATRATEFVDPQVVKAGDLEHEFDEPVAVGPESLDPEVAEPAAVEPELVEAEVVEEGFPERALDVHEIVDAELDESTGEFPRVNTGTTAPPVNQPIDPDEAAALDEAIALQHANRSASATPDPDFTADIRRGGEPLVAPAPLPAEGGGRHRRGFFRRRSKTPKVERYDLTNRVDSTLPTAIAGEGLGVAASVAGAGATAGASAATAAGAAGATAGAFAAAHPGMPANPDNPLAHFPAAIDSEIPVSPQAWVDEVLPEPVGGTSVAGEEYAHAYDDGPNYSDALNDSDNAGASQPARNAEAAGPRPGVRTASLLLGESQYGLPVHESFNAVAGLLGLRSRVTPLNSGNPREIARQCIDEGASALVVLGNDAEIAACASAAAGTGVPLAVIPHRAMGPLGGAWALNVPEGAQDLADVLIQALSGPTREPGLLWASLDAPIPQPALAEADQAEADQADIDGDEVDVDANTGDATALDETPRESDLGLEGGAGVAERWPVTTLVGLGSIGSELSVGTIPVTPAATNAEHILNHARQLLLDGLAVELLVDGREAGGGKVRGISIGTHRLMASADDDAPPSIGHAAEPATYATLVDPLTPSTKVGRVGEVRLEQCVGLSIEARFAAPVQVFLAGRPVAQAQRIHVEYLADALVLRQ